MHAQHLFNLLFGGHHHPNVHALVSGETLSSVLKGDFTVDFFGSPFTSDNETTMESINTQTLRFHTCTHFTRWKWKKRSTAGVKTTACEQNPSSIVQATLRYLGYKSVLKLSYCIYACKIHSPLQKWLKKKHPSFTTLQSALLVYQIHTIFSPCSNDLLLNYELIWKDQYLLAVTNSLS